MDGIAAVLVLWAILGQIDRTTAQTKATDDGCSESWNVTVTNEIVVKWSGIARTADIGVVIAPLFPIGTKCLKKLNVRVAFNDQEVSPPKPPCKGTTYQINVTLICSETAVDFYSTYVSIPPDDLSVVQNVRVGNVADTSIDIQWDELKVQGHLYLNYAVRWNEVDTDVAKEEITNNSYCTIQDLNSFTNYSIQVRALSDNETGNWSDVVVVRTALGDLSVVQNVRVRNVTDTSIDIQWDELKVKGHLYLNYAVRWNEVDTDVAKEEITKDSYFTIQELNSFTNYSIQVRALSGNETGNWSDVTVVRTAAEDLSVVQNVLVGNVTDTSIDIQWDELKVQGHLYLTYAVRWNEADTDVAKEEITKDSYFTIQDLNSFTNYSIQVRALSGDETGNWSDVTVVRTAPGVPSAPLNVTTAIDSTSIMVRWEEPEPFKGPILFYTIIWRQPDSTTARRENTSNLYYDIEDLIPLTYYYVRVCATTSAGKGNWSKKFLVQTKRPDPPKNLRKTSVNSSNVEVAWDLPQLYVERGIIVAFSIRWNKLDSNESQTENTTDITFTLTELSPFTKYSIQVCAWTTGGSGEWTLPLEVQTEIGIPFPPRNIEESRVTNSSIEVKWDEPTPKTGPIDSYTVRWSEAASGETIQNSTTNLFYLLEELLPSNQYFIKVRASTSAGSGNWSRYIIVQTAVGIPSAPSNVTVEDVGDTSIALRWDEPTPFRGPITSYSVQWGRANSNSTESDVTNKTNYTMLQLDAFTSYSVQVRASTEAGLGKWSDAKKVRTAIGIPSTPRKLKEKITTNSSIEVEWKEPEKANGPILNYTVRWTNLNNEVASNRTTKAMSYLIEDLNPFTNHSVQVRAITAAGYGDWSDDLIIRTDIGVPSNPTDVRVRRVTDTSIELLWTEPEPLVGDITHYILQWKNAASGEKGAKKSTNTFYKLKDLDPYTNYSIKVRAATSAGVGIWSDAQVIPTSSGVPLPPRNIQPFNVTNSTIDLEWEEPKPFKGPIVLYTVHWTNSDSFENWTENTNSSTYRIEGLKPYAFYNIAIKAKTDAGFGPWSNVIKVRTEIGIPTAPQNVSEISKTAWSIEISWIAPESPNGPLLTYKVLWGKHRTEMSRNLTNNTYFKAEHLAPYTEYSFQVYASTEVGYGDQSEIITTRTNIAVPSEPIDLTLVSATNISLAVKWKEPEQPNGPILGYSVQWGKFQGDANETSETPSSNFLLSELDPYSNYSIRISGGTEAGFGPWTDILVAATEIGVPKSAQLLSVEVESSRTIVVEWETPNPYPGPTNYTLQIWRKPRQCESAKKDIQEATLEGVKGLEEWEVRRQEMVENLLPYTQYYARILLETSVGGSDSLNSSSVRTLPERPGAPMHVQADCKQSSTETEVRWNPPLKPNGKIVEYLVKYGMELMGWNERTISVSSQCKEHRIMLQGLRPERKYKIYVQAKVEDVSEKGDEGYMRDYCILPAGVPPMGNIQYAKVEGSGPYRLVFEWCREVFSDSMGALVNYAVLVGVSAAVGNATSGRSAELYPSWTNFSAGISSSYQATPVDWNPFDKEKDDPLNCEEFVEEEGVVLRSMFRCTIGLDSLCSSDNSYCNGPLQPETTYGMKIRAFTRGGYAETEVLFAKTGPIPGSSLIGGLIGGFIFLLLITGVIAGGFVLKRKGKLDELRLVIQSKLGPRSSAPSAPAEQVLHLEACPIVKTLTSQNFGEHVQIMMSDSHLRFSQEFEALKSSSPKFPCSIAEMEENRSKNRWLNIFPYDHSRVKLLPLGDEPASDFVNANYIPGHSSLREYIASQGPLAGTVDDFWRMVWEQSVTMIVMLTQCVERGKNKCEQYWPPAGEAKHYGDVQVRALSESMLSSYIIRVFHVQLGSQERMVKQMHFTHWPDFGCPESPEDLINFVRAVRDHLPRIRPGPILVHCSAGVGRTGTFITVDRLSQQLPQIDSIDIYGTVMELRHHRINMVQTEDQYIYIHLCVKELVNEINEPPENEYEGVIYSNIGEEQESGF